MQQALYLLKLSLLSKDLLLNFNPILKEMMVKELGSNGKAIRVVSHI
jgi:hypothetical protein